MQMYINVLTKDVNSWGLLVQQLFFGDASRLPVYYRKLPGNIPDVKTVQDMLADIDFLELNKVKLVMGLVFHSEANINELYQRLYKFLIAAKTSLELVKKKLDKVRTTMVSRPHYNSKHGIYYDSLTKEGYISISITMPQRQRMIKSRLISSWTF